MAEIDPDKYIVFKRDELHKHVGDMVLEGLSEFELTDAVVIRRQDLFASPCLLTYAAMMSMVAKCSADILVGTELQMIADYFHDQGVRAGEEGWKLPSI